MWGVFNVVAAKTTVMVLGKFFSKLVFEKHRKKFESLSCRAGENFCFLMIEMTSNFEYYEDNNATILIIIRRI